MGYKPDPASRVDIDKVTTNYELAIPIPEPSGGADILAIWEENYEKIDNQMKENADNIVSSEGFRNITRHNNTTDIPTMQDNSSNYLDVRLDSITGKMYICTNETGSAAVANPTSDFEKISVWENAKKLETLSTENFKEVVLYEGTWQTTGVLTLNDNWNNYKEIVIAGYDTTYGNETHNRFRTSLITASDTSTQHQVGESCLYNFNDDYVTGYFRETNKNEINVTGRSSGTTLTKIIGIGKIG
ncbi:hypothetical protein [uncultured Ilyobacter sp.]|uniref:hypothetical protein n=1 Tax=uncultured Ilyobacter sp. TaxID=544433 RepID=UPI0029C68F74|nr:hypothetical protein [uncultured Ilyobacter sp.]